MADINKEYYPYPGYDHYYQVTKNPFSNIPKPVHTKTYTTDEVDEMIKYVLSKISQSKGVLTETVTFANLPDPGEENIGTIYNITDSFITDNRFLEGAGKVFPEGCNVIVVLNNGSYKFDVFMGEITPISDEGIEDIIDDLYKDE